MNRRLLYLLRNRFPILLGAFLLMSCSGSFAQENKNSGCPTLRHGYGPFDYRTATVEQKRLVEGAHFFPNVENLRKGTPHPNRGYIVVPGSEIDYTLRAFPNHPRALLSLSRLSAQSDSDRPPGVKASVECYFLSAINFRPDDSMVRVIYGTYLTKKGRIDDAILQFNRAKELGAETPSMYYNLGLAYTEVKRYKEALESAHMAYAMGAQLPGLRDKLKRVGVWIEPSDLDSTATNAPNKSQINEPSQQE